MEQNLRRKVIKKYFGQMNDRQFEAVTTVKGPLLVLAGAGSGKTTVLVNRILNLIRFGNCYNEEYCNANDYEIKQANDYLNGTINTLPEDVFDKGAVSPWNILAITFTNKAAGELKERIVAKLGEKGNDVWAGTFHSVCGKILRYNAEYIGYTSHFTIYDTDDQRRLMKDIMKQHNIDEKFVPHKTVLSAISSAKDKLISPAEYTASVGNDFRQKTIAQLYSIYQKRLKDADAMDFDDMIVNTVELLDKNPDILQYYTRKFRYVMVDEYQDTNYAQYVLVSLLASGENNLCVVGDDDQSIYRFRGATIENILNFEDEYKGAKTIRLEQNYRSTSNILNAANSVILNNKGRKGKTLWTDKGDGDKIILHTANDEREEARFVADAILESVESGNEFNQHAVLYRMNAQSNALENVFARSGIAYKVIGGMRFFDRKEIKDVLAYLQLINNNNDDLRLRRIINEPKRAIGDTTVSHAADIAAQLGCSIFEVIKNADEYAALSRAANKLKSFAKMIESLSEENLELPISELFERMLEMTGYLTALENEGEEAIDRVENVKEFASNIAQFELENDEPTLSAFLEEIALVSDLDSLENDDNRVILMTVHAAKGLEFDNVYLVGLEEGIFPGNQSIYGGPEDIEEERRLAYVAITRAKKRLTVTNTYMRMMFGCTNRNMPSRFLKEIPLEYCESPTNNSFYMGTSYKKQIESQSYDYDYSSKTFAHSSALFHSTNKAQSSNNSFAKNSSFIPESAKSSSASANNVTYKPGQMVMHKTFGKGMIISAVKAGGDTMLEIGFENVGTKKIMANFAKLTILN